MKNSLLKIAPLLLLVVLQACTKDKVNPNARVAGSGDIQTIAGLGPSNLSYTGDGGAANLATVAWVTGIATDQSNNIYITDGAANTVRIINAITKQISTIVGTTYLSNDPHPYSGDGGAATAAHLNIPLSVVVDGAGNLAIADAGNNVIRFVTVAGGKISTIAGVTFPSGYSGDGGLATLAKLWNPYSVATDAVGNIYFADRENNVVRMVTKSTGTISTLAGLGPDHPGYSGDHGQATAAALNDPTGVAVDANGNIYISDNINHVIRKISGGIITTIAGTGAVGYTGDNGLATTATVSASIVGLVVDASGDLYFADSGNNVVRKVSASTGIISTVAGNGTSGYSGDGGPALQAKLSGPLGVAIDGNGNLYIADTQNGAIRMVVK